MGKKIGARFRRRREKTPEPLMPGEAVDGMFHALRDGPGGKRYDLAAADQRTREIAEARLTLGLEGDDIEATLDEFEEAAE